MNGLYFMLAFIIGMLIVLVTYYAIALCSIYCHYRKSGLTRKQAFLVTWHNYV